MVDEEMGGAGCGGGSGGAGKAGEIFQGGGRGRATRALRLSALGADAWCACCVEGGGSRCKISHGARRCRVIVSFFYTADLEMGAAPLGIHLPMWRRPSDDN